MKKYFHRYDEITNLYSNNNKKYKRFWVYYLFVELFIRSKIFSYITELISNDKEISEFLDKNEFGLIDKTKFNFEYKPFIKKDVIDENTFYNEMNNTQIQSLIYQDFSEAILNSINKSSINVNIERYLALNSVEIDVIDNVRIFTVELVYGRDSIIESYLLKFKKLIKNLFIGIISSVLIIIIFLLIKLYY